MAADTDVEAILRECQDTVDYVTLDELANLPASQLVLLELPQPWKNGVRYRCMARASLTDYASMSAQRLGLSDNDRRTWRVLMPTYLPGVDLDMRDFEFLVRMLQTPSSGPTVLHVSRIKEAPPDQMTHYHEASVHVYELTEAQWERDLWQIFDRAAMPAGGTCPSGHPLVKQPAPPPTLFPHVICDLCEQTLYRSERHRCAENCDFDLCERCFGHGLPAEAEADRPRWLEQELAAFFREHPGFRPPRDPPRNGMQTLEVSTAVTKWNHFTLHAEDVPRLRHVFLRALRDRGACPDALRCVFWPGCKDHSLVAKRYIDKALCEQSVVSWRRNANVCVGAVVCVGASGLEVLAREPAEGAEPPKLASGKEALTFHARQLATDLSRHAARAGGDLGLAGWSQQDREELLDSVSACMAGGLHVQEAAAAAHTEPLAGPPTLFRLLATFIQLVIQAAKLLCRRW